MKPQEIESVLQSYAEISLKNGKVFTGYVCTWVDETDQLDKTAGDAIVIIPDSGNLKGKRVEIELKEIASYRIIQKQTT